jgi:hypothetical protein
LCDYLNIFGVSSRRQSMTFFTAQRGSPYNGTAFSISALPVDPVIVFFWRQIRPSFLISSKGCFANTNMHLLFAFAMTCGRIE